MHELFELKEKLLKELTEYGQENMTAGNLEIVDKLAHAVKNICKIIESAEEEYSQTGYSYEDGNRSYENRGGRYSRGYSRNRYSRRNEMGRYSREGGYSRTDGLEGLVETVRGMMQELPQNVQQDAQRFIQKLEQQM